MCQVYWKINIFQVQYNHDFVIDKDVSDEINLRILYKRLKIDSCDVGSFCSAQD